MDKGTEEHIFKTKEHNLRDKGTSLGLWRTIDAVFPFDFQLLPSEIDEEAIVDVCGGEIID